MNIENKVSTWLRFVTVYYIIYIVLNIYTDLLLISGDINDYCRFTSRMCNDRYKLYIPKKRITCLYNSGEVSLAVVSAKIFPLQGIIWREYRAVLWDFSINIPKSAANNDLINHYRSHRAVPRFPIAKTKIWRLTN